MTEEQQTAVQAVANLVSAWEAQSEFLARHTLKYDPSASLCILTNRSSHLPILRHR